MSDFKAKMHQIRFRLRLCPRPRWGSLQRSPDPLAGFKGPTSKGREGRGRKGGKGGEGKGEEKRKGREGKNEGRGGEGGEGWEGKFRGTGGRKERGREKVRENLGGAGRPKCFFLEPRLPIAEKIYTQKEYFGISNCVFNFNFLALVVSEILGVPNLH